MPVNSLMSAPAMNPLFLPDCTTIPRGGFCCSGRRIASNSRRTPLESTFVEVPGLSSVSQRMPSASVADLQEPLVLSFIGDTPQETVSRNAGSRSLRHRAGADMEIAHEWPVIRESDVRDTEVRDLDAFAHQDEVELGAWQ